MIASRFFLLLLITFSTTGIGQYITKLGLPDARRATARELRDAKRPLDLLIVNGMIVTMNPKHEIIQNGSIGIKNGVIEVMSDIPLNGLRAKRTINAAGKVIIPGLVNTHTHVPMVLFRGISDDLDLNDWLTKYIFRQRLKM